MYTVRMCSTIVAQVLIFVVLRGIGEEIEHFRLLDLIRCKVAMDGGDEFELRRVVTNLQAVAALVALQRPDAKLAEVNLRG